MIKDQGSGRFFKIKEGQSGALGFKDSFFVVAQPPTAIPQPELSQNALLTIEMNLTVEEYKGMDTSVAFS